MSYQSALAEVLHRCKLQDADADVVGKAMTRFACDIIGTHEWTFRLSSKATTTVANQATYTCNGANDDCDKLIDLYYDTNINALTYYDPREFDRRTYGATALGAEIVCWTIKSRSAQSFPIVTIFGTPTAAKALYYSYLVAIDQQEPWKHLPSHMEGLVIEQMVGQFHPDPVVKAQANEMVWNTDHGILAMALSKWQIRSLTYRRGRIDEKRRQRNREINLSLGYSDLSAGRFITNP